MSKDLFKEAIADAKAVREAALANAKLALEEAFTPHIKEMLAAKIEEMDNQYDEMEEAKMTDDMEEGKEIETEAEVNEEYYEESGSIEEELSLEEILAALEEAEKAESSKVETELEEAKKKKKKASKEEEKEEEKEDLDEVIDLEALLAEADEEEAEEETEETSEEEGEEVGEMTVEELKDLIRSIVGEMGGEDKTEMPAGEESSEEMEMVDLDELLSESEDLEEAKEEVEEAKEEVEEVMMGAIPDWQFVTALLAPALGIGTAALVTFKDEIMAALKSKDKNKIEDAIEKAKSSEKPVSESEEALAEIEALRTELNETNLLNAKLLYSNKIFRANELNENQKLRVINAFDKASNVNEAKLIYETIKDSFTTAKEKKQIKESLGFASKPTGTATSKSQIVAQPDNTVARLQKLAGII